MSGEKDLGLGEQGGILQAFSNALGREAHVLGQHPDLLWQQLHNRLQWQSEEVIQILSPQLEKRSKPGVKPWAKIRNPYQESRSAVSVLESGNEKLHSCNFNPEGTRIASAHGNIIKIWDVEYWKELFSLKGHSREVYHCTFSYDGRKIISASGDGTIKLWDADNGNELKTFSGHNGPVFSCAMSPDGSFIVSASEDNTVRIWNVASGENTITFNGEVKSLNPSINDCAVSPDGRWVVFASDQSNIKKMDAISGKLLLEMICPHTSYCCAISPDGKLVVSGGYVTKIWNLDNGEELHILKGHSDAVQSCAFSPDGRKIVTASLDTTLKIWDTESGKVLRTFDGHSRSVFSCAFSPDGRLIISASRDKTLRIWDTADYEEDHYRSGHKYWINSCAISPNGEWAITTSADSSLKVWDTANVKQLHSFSDHASELFGCAINPDNNWFVAGGQDKIIVWDVLKEFASHIIITHFYTGVLNGEFDCAVSPDGSRIVSASSDKCLRIWDSKNGQLLRTLSGHNDHVLSCAFSPDGERVISASSDRTLKIWETSTGHLLRTLTGHTSNGKACAISPDNAWVVSASRDDLIKILDSSNNNVKKTLTGHRGAVTDICVSQDGFHIFSCSTDKTIQIWRRQDGKVLLTIPMPAEINCIAMHPLPVSLACGDQSGNFYIFDLVGLPVYPLIATACQTEQHLVLRCPACNSESSISPEQLGKEVCCPWENCEALLLVNKFVIHGSRSNMDQHEEEIKISGQIALANIGTLFLGYSNGKNGLLKNDKTFPDILTGGENTPVSKLAVSPDGSKGICGSINGNTYLWKLDDRSLSNLIRLPGSITAVAIGNDGWKAIGYGEEGMLVFWKINENKDIFKVPLKSEITAIGMLPEAQILVGTKNNNAYFIDMVNKKVTRQYNNLANHITVIGTNQSSKRVIAGLADGHVLYGSTVDSFSVLRIKTTPILAISVVDRPCVLAGGTDGIVILSDFDSRKVIFSREFKERIVAGTLSPDGRFYAVLDVKGNIYRDAISRPMREIKSAKDKSDLSSATSEPEKKPRPDFSDQNDQGKSSRGSVAVDQKKQQPYNITAVDSENGPVVYCPVCQFSQPLSREMLGQEVACKNPGCNIPLKINNFVARSPDPKKKRKGK